jgi:hypothetical protein
VKNVLVVVSSNAWLLYAMVACLGVNDAVKVVMIKWRVLNVVAKKSVDVTRRSPGSLSENFSR